MCSVSSVRTGYARSGDVNSDSMTGRLWFSEIVFRGPHREFLDSVFPCSSKLHFGNRVSRGSDLHLPGQSIAQLSDQW